MLIENGDGTFTGGPLDVLCILHDVEAETYHVAFFEEKPLPGPVPDLQDTKVVRLKSKMHHTLGAGDLCGAFEHLAEMREKIQVPDENVWREPRDWDGQLGVVIVANNWRAREESRVVTL